MYLREKPKLFKTLLVDYFKLRLFSIEEGGGAVACHASLQSTLVSPDRAIDRTAIFNPSASRRFRDRKL